MYGRKESSSSRQDCEGKGEGEEEEEDVMMKKIPSKDV